MDRNTGTLLQSSRKQVTIATIPARYLISLFEQQWRNIKPKFITLYEWLLQTLPILRLAIIF